MLHSFQPQRIILAQSFRPLENRLIGPVTEISSELLSEMDKRIGKRVRTRYLLNEWLEHLEEDAKSWCLRGSPNELNRVIFDEPIDGRHYRFVTLKKRKATDVLKYQIWEIKPPHD